MKNFMCNKKQLKRLFIILLSILIFVIIDCNFFLTDIAFDYLYSIVQNTNAIYISEEQNLLDSQNLTMYTLDVGQSECLLFVQNNQVLLIDTGTPEYGIRISNFLKELGITKIDILICTHPHYDHMGGLSTILRNFDVGTFYMTNYDYSTLHKWWSYKNDKIMYFKNIDFVTPISGETIEFENSKIQFLTPISSNYAILNNYSIGVKISFGEIDFLCLADAENYSERELLKSDFDIEAEVFKVSHHGSTTSNSNELIEKVNPTYAVISVGSNNHYNHPREKTLKTLIQNDVRIFRTDLNGTVGFSTNGTNLSFFTN